LLARLVADCYVDSGNARLVFIDGAACHHDFGGVQRKQGEPGNRPEP
jgi:hypothetical protein